MTDNKREEVQEKEEEEEKASGKIKRLNAVCGKCKNNFKSCDFCQQQKLNGVTPRKLIMNGDEDERKMSMEQEKKTTTATATYNPVYNIREIRTVCHSFSSLGIDKKLLDIQISHQKKSNGLVALRRRSVGERRDVVVGNNTSSSSNTSGNKSTIFVNFSSPSGNSKSNCSGSRTSSSSSSSSASERRRLSTGECLIPEQVNANGKFLYI